MASSAPKPAPGQLLVAPPELEDPNFRRTVVFLCEHDGEGSFGLILNRTLSLKLDDVLDDVQVSAAPLSLGGPVQPNTLHFLHRFGSDVPDTVQVLDDVGWGGNFEAIRARVQTGETSPDHVRFFLGYAGWAGGQLEYEIEQGGWIQARATTSAIFSDEPTRLWRAVLRQMGGDYAVLANYPDDPRMN